MAACEEQYEDLAIHIVKQAVDDYVEAKLKLEKCKKNTREYFLATGTIHMVKYFFRSWWCNQLINIDGDKLLDVAEQKYQEKKKRKLSKTVQS